MTEPIEPIPSRAAVGRWGIERYVQLIRWPTLIAGIAATVMVLFQWSQIIIVLVQVAAMVMVGRLAARRGAGRIEGVTMGGLAGLVLGLMTGLSRFALAPALYWFINIVFESLLFGFIGAMISLGIVGLARSQKKLPN